MKWPQLLVCIVLGISFPILCHSQEPIGGPFKLVIYEVAHCDNSGANQISYTSTKISRISRTKYVYSGNFTTEVVLDDNISVFVDAAKWGNGGWRPHYFQVEFQNICSSMKTVTPVFFQAMTEMTHVDECPLPPGTYEVKELDIDKFILSKSFPSLPYGKFRNDVIMMINGTIIGCIRFFDEIVPAARVRPVKKNKNHH